MRHRIRRLVVIVSVFALLGMALAGYIASEIAHARAEARYEFLLKNYRMLELGDLEAWVIDQQELYLTLGPPTPDTVLRKGQPDILPFDKESFPTPFIKKLVGKKSEAGVIVYPVTIQEDPDTHEIVFWNAKGKEIWAIDAPNDYDSKWMALQVYPNLYDGSRTTEDVAEILAIYSPSRIQISVTLIPTEDLDQYLFNEEAILEAAQQSIPITMMRSGGGSTDVEILEISVVSTGQQILVGYPTNYYNTTWEVYTFDVDGGITGSTNMPTTPETNGPSSTNELGAVFEGIDSFWDIAETNLLFTGSTRTVWTDHGQMGRSNPAAVFNRFYGLGNADVDSDSDDLSDAMERFAYNSDPGDADTDSDDLDDGEEVHTYGTDVLDSDTDDDAALDGHDPQPTNSAVSQLYLNIVAPADGTVLGGYE